MIFFRWMTQWCFTIVGHVHRTEFHVISWPSWPVKQNSVETYPMRSILFYFIFTTYYLPNGVIFIFTTYYAPKSQQMTELGHITPRATRTVTWHFAKIYEPQAPIKHMLKEDQRPLRRVELATSWITRSRALFKFYFIKKN